MNLVPSILSGAAFGAALTASGVWNPSFIVAQMKLRDFHMLKVFLTAGGVSALAIHLLSRSGYVPKKPRAPSLLITGLPYDGNIIGGAMIGLGMTLTGACPGTVLVQVVTQTYPGIYSFAGGFLGGLLYVSLQGYLKHSSSDAKTKDEDLWLYTKLHVDADSAVLAWVAMYTSIVSIATALAPPTQQNPFLPPVLGGLFIGAAQVASLIIRRAPVGISTAYEDIGARMCSIFQKSEDRKCVKTATPSVVFAAGVMIGAAALVRAMPKFAMPATDMSLGISPARAVLGGVTMVFGARLAGGCTSGHGISGMSMLATASIVTVASMFASGMGLAQLLY
ncbi:hypothetical protein BDV96DRAFT_482613 [Lophiotrema nucula]|uniref:Uncharacterized protein n=1 Tax=Lophiotrema nucula TaxID=690887 RepID=A0A6A5ZRZ4_9PLEO|nr:hypothetical protein BDV96DRAFT_482613 [Lophiotrema nucula]